MPTAEEDDAFEIYVLEQILKNADPADAEIEAGNLGGGQDDGVDGFYLLADNTIVGDDNFAPKDNVVLELIVSQVTRSASWSEGKIHKLSSFMRHLLEWEPLDGIDLINQKAKDSMMLFRSVYEKVMVKPHKLSVRLVYVTKSENTPSSGIIARAEEVTRYIKEKLPKSTPSFDPWGASRIFDAVQTCRETTLLLGKIRHFDMPDTSVVCLSTVSQFAKFLEDEHGNIRTWVMDPNVRDYQRNNPVNKQIRENLNSPTFKEDFWWLNNGITILSDKCFVTGNTVSIDNPELVNGLQTSHEVFNARSNPSLNNRHILIKIIVAPEESSKNAITKATNYQTAVNLISLKANDPIQFAIEDRLLHSGLYYDRKKGKHRRLNRPISQMVSMKALGQAIIAAFLQKPSDARARPDSLLNSEKSAPIIFGDQYPLDFFAACILIDRQCSEFVNSDTELSQDAKTDLRFYLTTLVVRTLAQKPEPTVNDIAKLVTAASTPIDPLMLRTSLDYASQTYVAFGGNDKAAKGRAMESELLK
ncbi:MAG: AIPR family protein [Chthoniobacter sp.]